MISPLLPAAYLAVSAIALSLKTAKDMSVESVFWENSQQISQELTYSEQELFKKQIGKFLPLTKSVYVEIPKVAEQDTWDHYPEFYQTILNEIPNEHHDAQCDMTVFIKNKMDAVLHNESFDPQYKIKAVSFDNRLSIPQLDKLVKMFSITDQQVLEKWTQTKREAYDGLSETEQALIGGTTNQLHALAVAVIRNDDPAQQEQMDRNLHDELILVKRSMKQNSITEDEYMEFMQNNPSFTTQMQDIKLVDQGLNEREDLRAICSSILHGNLNQHDAQRFMYMVTDLTDIPFKATMTKQGMVDAIRGRLQEIATPDAKLVASLQVVTTTMQEIMQQYQRTWEIAIQNVTVYSTEGRTQYRRAAVILKNT